MLDKVTYKLLKKFYKHGQLSVEEITKITKIDCSKYGNEYIQILLKDNFITFMSIEQDSIGNCIPLGVFKINIKGRTYIEECRKTNFKFWIPYIVTTIIAIAALANSILARLGL